MSRYCGGVHNASSVPPSKRSPATPAHGLLLAGVMGSAAWLLTGCGSGPGLVSSVALPSEQQTTRYAGEVGMDAVESGPQPMSLDLTEAQRTYLDALTLAGVNPSSPLRALSIGSYICQARAAGQSDQTVWDSVAPMVRSDVADSGASAPRTATAMSADRATSEYVRIATQSLC